MAALGATPAAPRRRRRAVLSPAVAIALAALALAWFPLRHSGATPYAVPLVGAAALVWLGVKGTLLRARTQQAIRALGEQARIRAVERRTLGVPEPADGGRPVPLERRTLHECELLARHSRDVVLLLRLDDGHILEANAAATTAYGYTRDELLARTIHDLRADEAPRVVEGQMAEAGARGLLFETTHRRKDGSVFSVEVSSQGATIDGTRSLISVIRDITERQRAEEALRLSEQRLRAMFDHAGLGIVEVNSEFRFVAANNRTCSILGYRRDELLGRSVHEVTAPEDRARSDGMNARLFAGPPDVMEYDKRYLRADGTPVWLHVTVSAVRDASGRFARGIGTLEDISERKAAEADRETLVEALREADRRKDEFLGVLSHELRNPLAPIRNAVYLLKRAEPGSPQALRATEVIDRQTRHMTSLVEELLDVTRIARGKIELHLEPVDLSEVVRSAGEDHRSLMAERDVAFAVQVPDGATWVSGDRTRLEQIVGNVLQNAAKFTGRGGRVALALRSRDGQAEITVRDTGAGIDPALVAHVFDPFVQAEHTLARSSGGLGLGLALVKGLTELHGGTVAAHSEGAGRGSDFRITLPLLAADRAPA